MNHVSSAPIIDKCANCGKGEENSNKLKKCGACLSVKYCSKECQATHRPMHKKTCKKRAAEIYDEKLFKEVEPEECPLCMLTLPLEGLKSSFKSCCGKTICNGCIYVMHMSEGKYLCPFCREPNATSAIEHIERTKKLMDKGNANAFNMIAMEYDVGGMGLPQDYQKASESYRRAGELGCTPGYFNLGCLYDTGKGVEMDQNKAKYYFELAAMSGDIFARHNLGAMEFNAGNINRAMKHFILAARSGYHDSLKQVRNGFMMGFVTKDEYENTLRTCHKTNNGIKSDSRDKADASGMSVKSI